MLRTKQANKVVIRLLIIGIYLVIGYSSVYASSLDTVKTYFLKGDYQVCIDACKELLANKSYSQDFDQLYYFLGLSFLKLKDFDQAKGAFRKIIKESNDQNIKQQASLSLGDSYFLEGEFLQAESIYRQALTRPSSAVYLRLMLSYLKQGDWQRAEEAFTRLRQGFPLSIETEYAKNIGQINTYFTVQIGSFSKEANASGLCRQLKNEGYDSYVQEDIIKGERFFRVRVGRLNSLSQARALAEELSQKGYPVKIFP